MFPVLLVIGLLFASASHVSGMTMGRIRLGNGPQMGVRGVERKMRRMGFGIEVFAGPFGAGKTLLAVHLARKHAGRVCHGEDCGQESCKENPTVWQVYTNIPSTWDPEYGAWAKPVDILEQFMSAKGIPDHCVIVWDEGYQLADARLSMTTFSRELLWKLMQIRKKSLKIYWTAQSIDFLDRRIRENAQVIFNCWSDDEGRNVKAQVYLQAQGDIPPWERHNLRPELKVWNTEPSKGLYNTNDIIWERDNALVPTRNEIINFVDGDGEVSYSHVSDLVKAVITEFCRREVTHVTSTEVADGVLEAFGVSKAPTEMQRTLVELGYAAHDGRFQILAAPRGGLPHDG